MTFALCSTSAYSKQYGKTKIRITKIWITIIRITKMRITKIRITKIQITKIRITKVQIKKIQIRKNKRKNCMIHFIFRFSIFAPELSKSVQNFCKTVFFVLILASQNWIPKMICKRILVIFYTYFKIHPRLIFQFTIRDNIMHKTHFWGENYNAGHWW